MKLARRHPDLLAAAVAAALSVAGAVIALHLWDANRAVPLAYIGDSHFFLATIKGTLEHGWYLDNPDLGFPLGSQWQDFPVVGDDTLHLLIVHVIGLFTDNAVTTLHLFYLLGYALTAITAFVALRWLEISRWTAVVVATLFSLLPFHLFLGEAHPFHSSYWVVPLASILVLGLLLDRALFARREGSRRGPLSWASRTTLLTLGACAVVGSAGSIYYSLFAVGLVVVAGLLAAIRSDWRRSLASAGVIAGALLAVVAINLLPTIVYQAEHGENDAVAERTADESERYSLSLFGLLAPADGHRIGAFDALRDDYVETSPFELASVPGLGLIAALGFVWLIVFALTSIIRPGAWLESWRVHGAASAAALMAFLIATTGGFSLLFAHLVSPQLRVWARMYVFIAFFALVAVGALLDRGQRHPAIARRGKTAAAALLSAVLLLGFFDQTNLVPAYDQTRAEWESDATIVSTIEQELGPDAAVFQLPYVPFPEWYPSGGTLSFDPFRPYLHSSGIRWSYGAMYGRMEDWQPGLVDETVDGGLARISAAGFDGILVDRYGYPDDAERLETAIARETRTEPVASPNGRFSFFDLRPYAEVLAQSLTPAEIEALRAATLDPLLTQAGPGLVPARTTLGNYSPDFEMTASTAQLGLLNPSSEPREATLELTVPDSEVTLDVAVPGAGTRTLNGGGIVHEEVTLPRGTSLVQLNAVSDALPGLIMARLSDLGPRTDFANSEEIPLQAGAEAAPAGTVATATGGAGP
jgi:phosphoglycerol transferase